MLTSHLNSESADFIDYYESKNKLTLSLIEKKHILYNAFPYYIKSEISDVEIIDNLKYNQVNDRYKKITDVGLMEKKIDFELHRITNKLEKKIIEMHQSGLSFNKIQKTLTEKCIESGIIPSTIERYSRGKNEEKKVIEIEPKLPLSTIKKIISDNVKLLENDNTITVELIE